MYSNDFNTKFKQVTGDIEAASAFVIHCLVAF